MRRPTLTPSDAAPLFYSVADVAAMLHALRPWHTAGRLMWPGPVVVDGGGTERVMRVVSPPGGYDDGPVYVRINLGLAGRAWPVRGCGFSDQVEISDPRCREDRAHVYLRAHNSHSAFVYCRWISEGGVPESAVAVVHP